MDQRPRQPVLRLPRVGVGVRLHLGGQQPREPAHALVERSRRAIRPGRPSSCATRRPERSGARRRCRSGATGSYVVRHGQGYSRFEHEHRGIATDLTHVRCRGRTPSRSRACRSRTVPRSARTLTVTAYAEWVLGPQRAAGAPFVVTELDAETGALFARNSWNEDLRRTRRVRRHRGRSRPAGRPTAPSSSGATAASTLRRASRAERSSRSAAGAGLDPCAALQARLRLAPGQRGQVVFLLGQGRDAREARRLVARLPVAESRRSRSPRCGASGRTRSPRSRFGRPTARWT